MESGSPRYAYALYHLQWWLLEAARSGTLSPDWRDTLTIDVVRPRLPVGGPEHEKWCEQIGHPVDHQARNDAETLALHEVVGRPRADWEPYANGRRLEALPEFVVPRGARPD